MGAVRPALHCAVHADARRARPSGSDGGSAPDDAPRLGAPHLRTVTAGRAATDARCRCVLAPARRASCAFSVSRTASRTSAGMATCSPVTSVLGLRVQGLVDRLPARSARVCGMRSVARQDCLTRPRTETATPGLRGGGGPHPRRGPSRGAPGRIDAQTAAGRARTGTTGPLRHYTRTTPKPP